MNKVNEVKGEDYKAFLEKMHSGFRTPDYIVENSIRKVVGVGIKNKEKVIAGEVNEVYDVSPETGNNLIVRISRNKNNRFLPEKWAVEKCKEIGVPVPTILLVEDVETKSEKLHVCVEDKIEGFQFQTLIKKEELTQDEIENITVQSGNLLSKIHGIRTKGFGNLNPQGVGEYKSWEEYMLKHNKKPNVLLSLARKSGVDEKLITSGLKILETNKPLYHNIQSRLAHTDYGTKHMLIKDGKINGILDFENVMASDIAYDFSWWNYFGENRPSVKWLIEGYKEHGNLGKNFENRMHLIKIRIALNLLFYYTEAGHPSAKYLTTKNLTEDIDYFN